MCETLLLQRMLRIILISSVLIGSLSFLKAANTQAPVIESPAARKWADSVLSTLTYQEKLGQLFMVDAFSNKDQLHVQKIAALVDSFHIGGLIFFQGGPVRQAELTNYYQSLAKIPLMIGIDGEWGLSMRLDSTIRYPRQMTLSAGADSTLVYRMGREIAWECKRMGIHINFAPTVDVNNNPLNPIINSRSFGEDQHRVALLGSAYAAGLQDGGVMACAKHFPGHGNTDSDSHLALPVVHDDTATLDSIALVPFRKLFNEGVASVMVAHLYIPSLDSTKDLAGTLSPAVVKGLLREKMGYKGLVFTDALNMKGVANYKPPGDLEIAALQAGNDILLYSENIPVAIEKIHLAIQNCELDEADIEDKVRRILMAKYWAGLSRYRPVELENLSNDLNAPEAALLNHQLFSPSVTLLRNKNSLIPLSPNPKHKIASLVIGEVPGVYFQEVLNRYAEVKMFGISRDASVASADSMLQALYDYDKIIVSIHNTSINAAKNFNITETTRYLTGKLSHRKNALLCVFGNAYVLGKLDYLEDWNTLVLCYEDTWLPQQYAAEKIFGVGSFRGHLPVSPEAHYKRGMGISALEIPRLAYRLPEEAGIASDIVSYIDTIVHQSIADTTMPGCQVLASVRGKVIYSKAFGYHTYDSLKQVKVNDLYDIASVTKIAATGLALMHLEERNKIEIDARASKYLPELKNTNKRDLTLRELMAHQAGLRSWIPFWQETVDSNGLDTSLYRFSAEEGYGIQLGDSLFLADSYRDTIWERIIASPVENRGRYVYSDLGLFILQRVVEKVSGESLDEYVRDTFYRPMGLWQCVFKPLDQFSKDIIVPTEMDTAWRRQLVHGYVHDPAAAMLGGVAGNAGLFSNAHSLAVIMQMLMNGGSYGGHQYLKQATVDKFTVQAFPGSANRRGLLFDKPDKNAGTNGPTAEGASSMAFGHSGFTGTCAWADPETGLVYVFLSNRVHPDASNNKLARNNVRTRVMQVLYDGLNEK